MKPQSLKGNPLKLKLLNPHVLKRHNVILERAKTKLANVAKTKRAKPYYAKTKCAKPAFAKTKCAKPKCADAKIDLLELSSQQLELP